MKQHNRIGLAAMLVCVFTPGLFADTITVFNLEDFPVGTVTPFTDAVAGLQASFSSNDDPAGFGVDDSMGLFKTLTGNILDSELVFNISLTIAFSAPQTSFSTNFATDTETGVPFNLAAFNGATAVGSSTATGTIPSGFVFPEGVISFSGPAFNSVVLSAPTADAFAIDNVTVSAVPEPSSLSLVAFVGFVGLCVSAITRLRRRRCIGNLTELLHWTFLRLSANHLLVSCLLGSIKHEDSARCEVCNAISPSTGCAMRVVIGSAQGR